MKTQRCALYTRKSSEEGLEQHFNSLHAQRDACAAYVLSQAGEGWIEVPTIYDDGGFSGGSMDRPALAQLMTDIGKGLIDVVVVYKVDRLTRSLADFARIVELFDSKGVSFVSVTQAFNTTNSMGRLTLNVLLSFAQFEREVTGERIRDKISASKKKGLWMGGVAPLGYDGVERKLVVNEAEAQAVRQIFKRYLKLGSVLSLAEDLRISGIRSKQRLSKSGKVAGDVILTPSALYHILANPTYRGGIRHKALVYENAHPAIIDQNTWDAVQSMLAGQSVDRPNTPRLAAPQLLQGRIFDGAGEPMTPTFSSNNGHRYRYYVSRPTLPRQASAHPAMRIAMGTVESFVTDQIAPRLENNYEPDLDLISRLRSAITRVTLKPDLVQIRVRAEAIATPQDLPLTQARRDEHEWDISFPIILKARNGAKMIEAPGAPKEAGRIDRAMVRAVAMAFDWAESLAKGELASVADIAAQGKFCKTHVAKLLPLAWLAPDLVELIVKGKQPAALTLHQLTARPIPLDWDAQRTVFFSA